MSLARAASFAAEKAAAITAVVRACDITSRVFNQLVRGETLTKTDESPVTIADFAAQALINSILHSAFPGDPIVAEEDSADLRADSPTANALRDRLTSLVNDALRASLRAGEDPAWGIGPSAPLRSIDSLLTAIDRGNHPGGPKGRMWTLDPIDGTKGFLLGEQYAVCLALIEDNDVKLSVMGCPNLPASLSDPAGERGCLFVAVKGQGAEQRPLSDPDSISKQLKLQPAALASLALLESREGAHSSHDLSGKISQRLGLTAPPVRMDSQAKYCTLARGEGGILLRLPIPGKGYQEKIWDHASGALLVAEAGGKISNGCGIPLDFGLGRTLGENFGVVAAHADIHQKVIEAIAQVGEDKPSL